MSDEKTHVVIKNGQRASETLTEQDANKRADQMREKIGEAKGTPARESNVQVKQNLCG